MDELPSVDSIKQCTDVELLKKHISTARAKVNPLERERDSLIETCKELCLVEVTASEILKTLTTELRPDQWYKKKKDSSWGWDKNEEYALVHNVGTKYVYCDVMRVSSKRFSNNGVLIDVAAPSHLYRTDDDMQQTVITMKERASYLSYREKAYRESKKEFVEEWEVFPNIQALVATDLISAREQMINSRRFNRTICKHNGTWWWVMSIR